MFLKTLLAPLIVIAWLGHAIPCTAKSDLQGLKTEINQVIKDSKAKVGVGLFGLDFQDSLVVNDAWHYPMQSVYKFPLAMAVLQQVDLGNLTLSQQIHIPKALLDTATWSPMVRQFPHQDIDLTLEELLIYTVSKSDNNGCDALFRLIGGPDRVKNYVRRIGIRQMAIATTEAEMKKGWLVQYTNWCQPSAMLQLLKVFYRGKALSSTTNRFLLRIMTESENSTNRIKGLLPATAVLAHKTGTSNTNAQGLTAATNDVGILTLPDGHHLALVIFVSDYKTGVPEGEKIIAKIARLIWNHYNKQ